MNEVPVMPEPRSIFVRREPPVRRSPSPIMILPDHRTKKFAIAIATLAMCLVTDASLIAQIKTGVAPRAAPRPKLGSDVVISPHDSATSIQFARINMGPNINSEYSEL